MPQFNPNIPWNDIPELPPAVDLESRDILKACISAMTELTKANALVKEAAKRSGSGKYTTTSGST